MKFYCENTGVLTEVDVRVASDLKINDRVFSSELAKIRNEEAEKERGCRLAHYKCFNHSSAGKAKTGTDIFWCRHDPSLHPARYDVVVRPRKENPAFFPFVVVKSEFSDDSIITASEFDSRGDPFENARLIDVMMKYGKIVVGSYKPLSETDVGNMLGLRQSAVHALRQFLHASKDLKKAYYDGLTATRVAKLCRLPEEEQGKFLEFASSTLVEILNRQVSDRLDELGIREGRSGYGRHRGNRHKISGDKKFRSLRHISSVLDMLQFEYDKRLANLDVGPDTVALRGFIQGLKYAVSVGELPDIEKKE